MPVEPEARFSALLARRGDGGGHARVSPVQSEAIPTLIAVGKGRHVPVLRAEELCSLRTAHALALLGGPVLVSQRDATRFPRTSLRGGLDRCA